MVRHRTSARSFDLLQRPLAVNAPLQAGDKPQRYISWFRCGTRVSPNSLTSSILVAIARWPAIRAGATGLNNVARRLVPRSKCADYVGCVYSGSLVLEL